MFTIQHGDNQVKFHESDESKIQAFLDAGNKNPDPVEESDLQEIYFLSESGKPITLQVDPDESILQVKEQLQEIEGISIDQQVLIYAGHQLNNNNLVSDYNFGKTPIHLIKRNKTVGIRQDDLCESCQK